MFEIQEPRNACKEEEREAESPGRQSGNRRFTVARGRSLSAADVACAATWFVRYLESMRRDGVSGVAWWALAVVNVAVPVLATTALLLALTAGSNDVCASPSAGQRLASDVVGVEVLLLPTALLLDLSSAAFGREGGRWRRLGRFGAGFCVASLGAVAIALLGLIPVCW
jgi:hypothetical protein